MDFLAQKCAQTKGRRTPHHPVSRLLTGLAAPAQGDRVVVMALNGGAAAQAVFVLGPDRVGAWSDHGGPGR